MKTGSRHKMLSNSSSSVEMPKDGRGCRNCGSSEINKDLAQGQHLCVRCLKSLPRIACRFCTVTFQQLPDSKRNRKVESDVCFICEHQFLKHGLPIACAICGNNSAFAPSEHCKLCASRMLRYGNPVPCSKCHSVRAFNRPDKHSDHQGHNYCFSCTRDLKLQHSSDLPKPSSSAAKAVPPDAHRPATAKQLNPDHDSQGKPPAVSGDRKKRQRDDNLLSRSDAPRSAAAEARELEITGLRRRVQEADERATKLEARCKHLELECHEWKIKHATSIKELDSYVCAHNMEKYQGKARETEWKNKFSILQADHSRLKQDFAVLERSVEIKIQDEVSVWRSRVAQLEDELRDTSRELKELRS